MEAIEGFGVNSLASNQPWGIVTYGSRLAFTNDGVRVGVVSRVLRAPMT